MQSAFAEVEPPGEIPRPMNRAERRRLDKLLRREGAPVGVSSEKFGARPPEGADAPPSARGPAASSRAETSEAPRPAQEKGASGEAISGTAPIPDTPIPDHFVHPVVEMARAILEDWGRTRGWILEDSAAAVCRALALAGAAHLSVAARDVPTFLGATRLHLRIARRDLSPAEAPARAFAHKREHARGLLSALDKFLEAREKNSTSNFSECLAQGFYARSGGHGPKVKSQGNLLWYASCSLAEVVWASLTVPDDRFRFQAIHTLLLATAGQAKRPKEWEGAVPLSKEEAAAARAAEKAASAAKAGPVAGEGPSPGPPAQEQGSPAAPP